MADVVTYITRPGFDDTERMDRHDEPIYWNRYITTQSAALARESSA